MDSYEKKQLIYKFVIILIITSCIVAIASAGVTKYYLNVNGYSIMKEDSGENSDENIAAIAKTLKNFRSMIDRNYIGEIDESKMLDETIKGYINGLDDEYSEYFTKEEWNEFEASALGNYVGIGIYMSQDKSGNIVVVSPIKETPAEEAGIQTEDIIVEVDGESVIGETTDVVASKIKGEPGTKVKLKLLRDSEYIDLEIERKEIKVYHVESKMLENNIGYIELITFDEGCAEEIKNAYLDLKNQGAKKIILDLRYNTGGLVDESLEIADMIIPKDKTLLITVDSKNNKEISKSKKDVLIDCDIVVLVNEYSASASEILTGALKDNGEATIVGTKTYGKGVIQNVYMLQDGSALKLTVNEYFTPNETKINKIGIDPDYEVELNSETEEDEQLNKAIELLK